jgi:hypothetical protein
MKILLATLVTGLGLSGLWMAGSEAVPQKAAAKKATAEAAPTKPGESLKDLQQVKEILSDTYVVNQKYRSMKGPYSQKAVHLGDAGVPELLWITGYRAVMVGADGATPKPQEFMCHSNLDIDPGRHNSLFKSRIGISGRLFTLSQGQFDIDLPAGFGIPILSTEPLKLTTQVLNLNHDKISERIRHKVEVVYVRDRDLKEPIRPLFASAAYGLASLEGEALTFGRQEEEDHGASCLVAANAAVHEYKDPLGRRFTGHWVVKPGREVNRTLVTDLMNLPFDTTVHYIAVHLHPFAETLELRDLTTDTTVFKSKVRPVAEGIGIDHVEYFSSEEGLPLYKSHDYEMVSVYNNTSAEEQDSMAVMYMYLLDKEFTKPLG